jgi:hypothetical protein
VELIGVLVDLALGLDADLEPLGEEVHAGDAHAVQAAGDLVGPVAELAAGVQLGEDDFQRVLALELRVRVRTHGNAAAVVLHAEGAIHVDDHLDVRAVPRQGLVHRVVHDLVHELVEPVGHGVADVHAGALPDRFAALELGDAVSPILHGRRGDRCAGSGGLFHVKLSLGKGALKQVCAYHFGPHRTRSARRCKAA